MSRQRREAIGGASGVDRPGGSGLSGWEAETEGRRDRTVPRSDLRTLGRPDTAATPASPAPEPSDGGSRSDADRPARPVHVRLGTRQCLDGIRAFAVLAVIGFHLGYGFLEGGYFGVDVFFVLSGFLITSLMLREYTRVGFLNAAAFWSRRARRLWPAMLVCLVVILLLARVLVPAEGMAALRSDALASLLYVSNWARVARGDSYFDLFAAKSPMEHFWSLAIEEQFYLFWPFVAGSLFRWSKIHRATRSAKERYGTPLILVGSLGALGSALIMGLSYSPGRDNSSLYFRTDTRLQAIFVGVAVAGVLVRVGRIEADGAPRWFGPSGLVAIGLLGAAMFFGIGDGLLYRGGFLLVAGLAGWAILVAMLQPNGALDTFLRARAYRRIGELSYGLYLWHWPAILLADKTGWARIPHDLLAIGLTVAAATLSFRYVETPIRAGRLAAVGGGFSRRESAAMIGSMGAAALLALVVTSGAQPSAEQRYAADQNVADSEVFAQIPDQTTTAIIGDAFGAGLGTPPAAAADSEVVATNSSSPACVEFKSCVSQMSAWTTELAETSPDVVLVATSSWTPFVETELAEIDPSAAQREINTSLKSLFEPLTKRGVSVAVLTPPPAATSQPRKTEALRGALDELVAANVPIRSVEAETLQCGAQACYSAGSALDATFGVPGLLDGALTASRVLHVESITGSATAGSAARVLLVGDSIGWSIGTGWYEGSAAPPSDAKMLLLNRGRFYCHVDDRPARDVDGTVRGDINTCADWRTVWASAVEEFEPDVVILPMSLWTVMDRKIGGTWVDWWDTRYQGELTELYEEAVQVLARSGATVVLLSTAPQDPNAENDTLRSEQNRRLLAQNRLAEQIAAAQPDTTRFIDLATWACPENACRSIGGLALRPDGLHFSATGSAAIAGWLEPQLLDIADAQK